MAEEFLTVSGQPQLPPVGSGTTLVDGTVENAPLVWDGTAWSQSSGRILTTFIQPFSDDVQGIVQISSGIGADAGQIIITLGDGISLFPPIGLNILLSTYGNTSTGTLDGRNSALEEFTCITWGLLGEGSDVPAVGFFGVPIAVQPTVGGSTTTDLGDLQQVVRNMLTALEGLGLWIDGTV